jgi:hypothetical protein
MAYATAQSYELNSLEEQAKGEIERLGSSLDLPMVLRVVENTCPHLSMDDEWLISYTKSRTKMIVVDTVAMEKLDFGNDAGNRMSVAEIILQSMVESIRENFVLKPKITEKALSISAGNACKPALEADSGPETEQWTPLGSELEMPTEPALEAVGPNLGSVPDELEYTGPPEAPSQHGATTENPMHNETSEPDDLLRSKKGKRKKNRFVGETPLDETCQLWEDHVNSDGWKACLACSRYVLLHLPTNE